MTVEETTSEGAEEIQPMTPMTYLPSGKLLQTGRYCVESLIGTGGMGAVYLVRDTHFDGARPVLRALKEMVPRHNEDRTHLELITREANMLATLKHRGIPAVHDLFIETDRVYIVLDFVAGLDLQEVLRRSSEMLAPATVIAWMIQLCDIVHYLHSRQPTVIFRDLKPSNVILTPDNEIVLIDFGIAKIFAPDDKQTTIGTDGYAAPEQYEGRAETRSDIYSLGAMLHHMLTRLDPRRYEPFSFAERMPRAFNPAISPKLEAVIMRCLRKPLVERFQTVGELEVALREVLAAETGDLEAIPTEPVSGAGGAVPIFTTPTQPRVAWRFRTDDEIRATPVSDGDLLFVGSYDGRLYALDMARGERVWQYATEGGVCGMPALSDHLVIFGSEDFAIHALDRRSGEEVWCYRTWKEVRSSPRVYDGRLFVGSDDGHCYALDPRKGQLLWKYRAFREVQTLAAYAAGLVYFGALDEYLYALDAATGERKWSYRANGSILSSPAIAQGHIYFGSLDFSVYCLEARLGWVAWSERTDKFVVSSPAIADDRVFIGSTDGHLYCLHRRTGQRLWRFDVGAQVNGTPACVDDRVYFGGTNGILYCVAAASGKLWWHFATEGKITGAPCIHAGRVYIGSTDGWLYAIEPPA